MSYRGSGGRSRSRTVVGVTSRSSSTNLQWLMDFLRTEFGSHVSEVRYLPITNDNELEWRAEVRTCAAGVLYHTKNQGRINITDVEGALYQEELQYLSDTLGREKVLVVLDDLEDTSEEERWRILQTQPSLERLSSQVVLIPGSGKRAAASRIKRDFLTEGVNTWEVIPDSYSGGAYVPSGRASAHSGNAEQADSRKNSGILGWFGKGFFSVSNPPSTSSYPTRTTRALPATSNTARPPDPPFQIRIFSRSAETNYAWLVNRLNSDSGLKPAEIRSVCVTNNYEMFRSELPECQFAILYHTQKQGRINITDVTDSLYDRELKELSEDLGRENVIVVVDDLRSSSPAEKQRLQETQPSICQFARDLFLFTEKEKTTEKLEEIIQIIRRKLQKVPTRDSSKNEEYKVKILYKEKQNAVHFPGNKEQSNSTHGAERSPNSPYTRLDYGQNKSSSQRGSLEEPESKKIFLEPSKETFSVEVKKRQDDLFTPNPPTSSTNFDSDQNKASSRRGHSEKTESKKKFSSSSEESYSMEVGKVRDNLLAEPADLNIPFSTLVDTLNKKWADSQQRIQDLSGQLRTLEGNVQDQKATISSLQAEAGKREDTMRTLQGTIAENDKVIQMLEDKGKKKEKELQERENIAKEKERNLQIREGMLRDKEKVIERKEKRLQDKQIEEERKMKRFQEKEQRLEEREKRNQEKERFLEEEQKRIKECRVDQRHRKDDLATASDTHTKESTSDSRRAKNNTEQLEQTILQLRDTIKEQEEVIERQSNEIKNFELIVRMKDSNEI